MRCKTVVCGHKRKRGRSTYDLGRRRRMPRGLAIPLLFLPSLITPLLPMWRTTQFRPPLSSPNKYLVATSAPATLPRSPRPSVSSSSSEKIPLSFRCVLALMSSSAVKKEGTRRRRGRDERERTSKRLREPRDEPMKTPLQLSRPAATWLHASPGVPSGRAQAQRKGRRTSRQAMAR